MLLLPQWLEGNNGTAAKLLPFIGCQSKANSTELLLLQSHWLVTWVMLQQLMCLLIVKLLVNSNFQNSFDSFSWKHACLYFWKYMGRNKYASGFKLRCLCPSISNFGSISAFHPTNVKYLRVEFGYCFALAKIWLLACHVFILSPKKIEQSSKICFLIYLRHEFSGA